MIDLRLGDCLEIMTTLKAGSIDAVITDPPYGVGLGVDKDTRRGRHGLGKGSYSTYEDTYENFVAMIVPRLEFALSIAKRGAVFTGPHIQEQPKASAIGGIYCPSGTGRHSWGFKTFLPVLFYGKDHRLNLGAEPNTIESNAVAEKNGHPCPKPLAWMQWLIERVTKPGELVLDPFMGSGTTAVACLKTGRRFIGIEIDPRYHEIAKRMFRRTDTPLFTPVEAPRRKAESPLFAALTEGGAPC